MPFLVKFKDNWADEFDVHGFEVMSGKEIEQLKEAILKVEYPLEAYFGTNEGFTFDSAIEINQSLEIKELTKEEADIFNRFFPYYDRCEFGWTPFGIIMESLSEEEYDRIYGENS